MTFKNEKRMGYLFVLKEKGYIEIYEDSRFKEELSEDDFDHLVQLGIPDDLFNQLNIALDWYEDTFVDDDTKLLELKSLLIQKQDGHQVFAKMISCLNIAIEKKTGIWFNF